MWYSKILVAKNVILGLLKQKLEVLLFELVKLVKLEKYQWR